MIAGSMTVLELATRISESLRLANIEAVLSGGSAVSIYTKNRYLSKDLDFVTSARLDVISKALIPLGFQRNSKSRYFKHADIDWVVEFPPGPLQIGDAQQAEYAIIETEYGHLNIMSPTQMVMDRLAAYFYWNDPQSLDQAVWITEDNTIDWQMLKSWVEAESQTAKYMHFTKQIKTDK